MLEALARVPREDLERLLPREGDLHVAAFPSGFFGNAATIAAPNRRTIRPPDQVQSRKELRISDCRRFRNSGDVQIFSFETSKRTRISPVSKPRLRSMSVRWRTSTNVLARSASPRRSPDVAPRSVAGENVVNLGPLAGVRTPR
jgi:hypothetical protein